MSDIGPILLRLLQQWIEEAESVNGDESLDRRYVLARRMVEMNTLPHLTSKADETLSTIIQGRRANADEICILAARNDFAVLINVIRRAIAET